MGGKTKERLAQMVVSGTPVWLVELIDELANSEGRSRSAQIVVLLKENPSIKRMAELAEATAR